MQITKCHIDLIEYQSKKLDRGAITEEMGARLYSAHGQKISVDFPTPKTEYQWHLTSQGWVGHIAVTPDFTVSIHPKVSINNLFRMLEYAYRLDSFEILPGVVDTDSMADLYERLANILSKRVLDRHQKGLYRAYIAESDQLAFVRGRLDVVTSARRPWQVKLDCEFEEHTADIEDNQILAVTLNRISRSGLCTDRSRPTIRRAYRALKSVNSSHQMSGKECIGRFYHRLNEDYEPLHALCRFFLEGTGPQLGEGEHAMLPFLLNMARLYELFVAEWLKAHLPKSYYLKSQETVQIDDSGTLKFNIDLVIYDSESEQVHCVLDTKYKNANSYEPADIAQVMAYAVSKGCHQAILVYPKEMPYEYNQYFDNRIRVRGLTFSLDGDLDQQGHKFLKTVFSEEQTLI